MNGQPARVDRGSLMIGAAPPKIYRAMTDPVSLEAWLPPEGMAGRMERFDPRTGGGFRLVLTYLDAGGAAGKTSDATDVADVEFVALVPDETVVQRIRFVSDDPDFAGTMTMTWELREQPAGTLVSVAATDVPPGISQADHEAGIASSLANLATHVEQGTR